MEVTCDSTRMALPCLQPQLDLGLVSVDREGLLDDPEYQRRTGGSVRPTRQNVAPLSGSVASSVLAQFVSLTTGPGGTGDPGPIQLRGTHIHLHTDHAASRAGWREYSRSMPPSRERQRTAAVGAIGSDLAIGVRRSRPR